MAGTMGGKIMIHDYDIYDTIEFLRSLDEIPHFVGVGQLMQLGLKRNTASFITTHYFWVLPKDYSYFGVDMCGKNRDGTFYWMRYPELVYGVDKISKDDIDVISQNRLFCDLINFHLEKEAYETFIDGPNDSYPEWGDKRPYFMIDES